MVVDYGWDYLLNFMMLTVLLGIAMTIKLNFKLFQKHLVPTAIIAGILGFVLGDEVLGLIHFDISVLEKIIYHLMAIGFIALALKDRGQSKNKNNITVGFMIVNTYLFQAILGFGVALILMTFFMPDLFPNVGLLLPLGFAQGPGQAYSTGSAWEVYEVFSDGGNIGLSVAAIGFVWAIIGGVPFMNFLIKKVSKKERTPFNPADVRSTDADNAVSQTSTVPKSIHIDDFTVQLILIGLVYTVSFLFLSFFETLMTENFGNFGAGVARLFWGFNFMFGTLFGLIVRFIMDSLRKKRIFKVNYADNYLLQKVSSACFDFMIAASITAISINALKQYLLPVIIITTVGAIATMVYVYAYCKVLFKDEDPIEHMIGLYGTWTGTVTTGVALLKEVDPANKTNVIEHVVLGSGYAIFLGIPLMVILAVPEMGYAQGKPIYYVITMVIFIVYSGFMHLGMFREKIFKKKA